jgi:hypothetical protein
MEVSPGTDLGIVADRHLIAIQTFDISRLTTHPVEIVPGTFVAVSGVGPDGDSNGSGKTSFQAAVSVLLGTLSGVWRPTGEVSPGNCSSGPTPPGSLPRRRPRRRRTATLSAYSPIPRVLSALPSPSGRRFPRPRPTFRPGVSPDFTSRMPTATRSAPCRLTRSGNSCPRTRRSAPEISPGSSPAGAPDPSDGLRGGTGWLVTVAA